MISLGFLTISLFISILQPQTLATGAAGTPVLNDVTDTFINQLLAEWKSPGGVSVAVVQGDGQGNWSIETKGYGVAKVNGRKVTEKTLFAIGSNSKLFTSLATGLLISNETLSPRLTWDTKISSVIDGWAIQGDPFGSTLASITDLMSHRTGLPRHDFSYKWTDDVPSVIKKIKSQRPSAEFRQIFQYNNNMYTTLSYLPTLLLPSKPAFARYVKQHIFEPLGLTSTTYSYDVAKLGDMADGFARQGINLTDDPLGGTPRGLPYWSIIGGEDGNIMSGAGGVISNAVDMATWLQMLLLNGRDPKSEAFIISPDVVEKVSAGIMVANPQASFPELSPSVYGGGQLRSSYRGHEVVEHDGGTPGFLSYVARLPFDNLGVAILSNDNEYGAFITAIIKYRLIDEALGLEKVDWNARYKQLLVAPPPNGLPRPANASLPSLDFASLTGVYHNDGYGKVELCYIPPKQQQQRPRESKSCNELSSNLSTILPGAAYDVPTFIIKWDSPWASHLRLRHFSGNLFNVSALSSYPTNNASEPFWTYGGDLTYDTASLATSVVEGNRVSLALSGVWGPGLGVERLQGKTPRERAEVWFDKM